MGKKSLGKVVFAINRTTLGAITRFIGNFIWQKKIRVSFNVRRLKITMWSNILCNSQKNLPNQFTIILIYTILQIQKKKSWKHCMGISLRFHKIFDLTVTCRFVVPAFYFCMHFSWKKSNPTPSTVQLPICSSHYCGAQWKIYHWIYYI